MAHTLRLLAHRNGCSLIYSGIYEPKKNEELDRNFRAIMNYVTFSIQGGLKSETDPMKPLRIVAGRDNLKAIGDVSDEGVSKNFVLSFGEAKVNDQQALLESALLRGFDEYVESSIDVLAKQKEEELDRFRKKKEQEEKEKEQKRLEQAELKKKASKQ
jgi:Na+/phosphate symporter